MNSKAWKLSASVIIALRSNSIRESILKIESSFNPPKSDSQSSDNLHILSLRRGESDRHLPGIHVFPGGHLDESDRNPAWVDLFRSFGYEENSFASLSASGGVEHMPEYNESSPVPGWMSFRLCAIRETFEESGILLCRSPSGVLQGPRFATFVILNELTAWQSRVRADPRQMLALCQAVGCVPDLWGLHLWSNWLTPTQQRIRHNSVFFMAVLQALPPYSLDHAEMDELKWCSASELVEDAHSGRLRLANPQFYEASRLISCTNADALASFASNRSQLGCARFMPVPEVTKDGMLFILPGDSAYPKDVDCETHQEPTRREQLFDQLSVKIIENNGTLHRIEVPRGSTCQKLKLNNFVPTYQHILPVVVKPVRETSKSQL